MLGWELPPHNSGGLGVACYHLSKALALQGSTIDFVVPYSAEYPNVDFMAIHNATKLSPLFKHGGLTSAYDSRYLNQLDFDDIDDLQPSDLRSVQKCYVQFVEELVERKKPDVIHTHDWLTMEAGMRAKELTSSPLIAHVHATEFDRSGNLSGNPLVHEIEHQGLVMADQIIAVSNITKDIIVNKYNIPADKVKVVYNALDLNSLDNSYEYDQQTYKYLEALKHEGYTVVLTVTRFTIQKGLTHLVRAAARASERYDKLVFLFVGDGEQRNELIQLVADLGIADKIFFTGFVRGKRWRDAYSVADIFVMSSVSEPFGLTALEAAHHDNALVITKQSGVGEVLHNILKYDFWDDDELADQLIGIATSQALKSELKKNIKHEYTHISWYDVAQTCQQIYRTSKQEVLA